MILHAVDLMYKDRLRLRGLSDMHIGSRAAEERRLRRDIETILSEEDSYVFLLGDQLEAISKSDLKRFQGTSVRADLLEEVDSILNAQLREAVNILKPLADAGRILGALEGNHEAKARHMYGICMHTLLCEKLNIKNLGYSAMVRLKVGTTKHKDAKVRSMTVYLHHGAGGSGRYTGGSINSMEQEAAWFDADLFFEAHNHKRHVSSRVRLGLTNHGIPRLLERDQVFIRTGSYLKTYQAGPANYGEVKAYPPTVIGRPIAVDIRLAGEEWVPKMSISQ